MGTIFFVVDLPDDHSLDVDSTHFTGNLLGFKRYQLRGGGELGDLVEGAFEGSESNFSSLAYSVVEDEYPFIGLSDNLESLDVLNKGSNSLDDYS